MNSYSLLVIENDYLINHVINSIKNSHKSVLIRTCTNFILKLLKVYVKIQNIKERSLIRLSLAIREIQLGFMIFFLGHVVK